MIYQLPLSQRFIGSSRHGLFKIIFLLLFFSYPLGLHAQVEPDYSRAFDLGRPVLFPGSSVYLGDIPHDIIFDTELLPLDTLTGWLVRRNGWTASSGKLPPGARNSRPGIFFEGIAYPFPTSGLLDWMPAPTLAEALDFPASAWWGPRATNGAIQLRAAPARQEDLKDFSLWGGNGGRSGFSGFFKDDFLVLDARTRHGSPEGDKLSLLSRAKWFSDDSVRLESGLLAAEGPSDDHWYSVYSVLEYTPQVFQTIQLKPFFQQARLGNETIVNGGAEARYHFNLAGLAEGHLGSGFTHSSKVMTGGSEDWNEGFFQASLLGDALGIVTADAAFRFDFSGIAPSEFSFLLGLQATEDIFTFLGDYDQGVLAQSGNDLREMGLGVRLLPDQDLSATLKYIFEEGDGGRFDGGQCLIQWDKSRPIGSWLKQFRFRLEERMLRDPFGALTWESSGRMEFSFSGKDRLWVAGRTLSDRPLFTECGASWSFQGGSKFYLSLGNLGDLPEPWPDPDGTAGLNFRAGIEGVFN